MILMMSEDDGCLIVYQEMKSKENNKSKGRRLGRQGERTYETVHVVRLLQCLLL